MGCHSCLGVVVKVGGGGYEHHREVQGSQVFLEGINTAQTTARQEIGLAIARHGLQPQSTKESWESSPVPEKMGGARQR